MKHSFLVPRPVHTAFARTSASQRALCSVWQNGATSLCQGVSAVPTLPPFPHSDSVRLNQLACFFTGATAVCLIALIALCVAWELWLAPLRPGGSWAVLKVLPLLLPLFGVLRGRLYTHQWASILVLLYATEGAVRAYTDRGLAQWLAGLELMLAVGFIVSAGLYARTFPRRQRQKA